MVNVIFADKTTVAFEDGSNKINLVKKVSSLAELDEIRGLFTAENVSGMKVGDEHVTDVTPVGMAIASTPAEAEYIYAVFTNRQKTELELLKEENAQQNEVLDMILMNMEV